MEAYLGHADDHRATGVKGKVLKAPFCIESAHAVIEWMSDDAHAADALRGAQRGLESVMQEIGRIPPALMISVDGKLTKQDDRHGIGTVPLLRLGQVASFDLRSAQSHIADDPTRRNVRKDAHTRYVVDVVGPCMTTKPCVEGVAPAIELLAIVAFGKWTRRQDRRHRLSFPRRRAVGEFGERGDRFGRSSDPRLEGLPVSRWDSDDGAVHHLNFSGLDRPPPHEFAQARMRLRRRLFQKGAFVRRDPNAENGRA